MNTRRYPRTTVEAFGCRGDDACALTRTYRAGHRAVPWALLAAAGYLAALLVWEMLP